MYDQIIALINQTKTIDESGDTIHTESSREIFAEQLSVGMKEFYMAASPGLKPEKKFRIADYLDYEGEEYLEHEGKRYKILRTYRTESNELEITVYGGINRGSSKVSDSNQ